MRPDKKTDCGCCEGIGQSTPKTIDNRPGLHVIQVRIGDHAAFKKSMLARLSDAAYPALASLATRDDDDFSIALLDAWAVTADILTFYQERFAQESYLRTASEFLSLQAMARLIGYKPAPGVAANTSFAFTIEDPPPLPVTISSLTRMQVSVPPVKIEAGAKVQSIPAQDETAQTFETIETIEAQAAWNSMKPRLKKPFVQIEAEAKQLYLEGVDLQLKTGDAILIVGEDRRAHPKSNRWDFRILETLEELRDVNGETSLDMTRVTWRKGLGEIPILPASEDVAIFVFRKRVALFGHNAPEPAILYPTATTSDLSQPPLNTLITTNWEWRNFEIGAEIDLDAEYPEIIQDDWIVLDTTPTEEVPDGYRELYRISWVSTPSVSDFALNGKITRIVPDTKVNISKFGLRETTVFAQGEKLTMSMIPSDDIVGKGTEKIVLDAKVPAIQEGHRLLITGRAEENGQIISEFISLKVMDEVDGMSRLHFESPLQSDYLRRSIEINANLAAATHGETVQEILGSGQATQIYPVFKLRQPPLTYISADTASGAESTLKIYVNDLLWEEAPHFYGRGPNERIYLSRADEEGNTLVQFGDGISGARLPTGQDNVRAEYRKGIGLQGLVRQGQLSQLLTRPLGLKAVVNPVESEGAADPEDLQQTRENAPLTVLTLDRAVSLQDYEDYARAFAGIDKAQADWVWDGRERVILITVAGSDGKALEEDGSTISNLKNALRQAGDPYVRFHVKNYLDARFRFGGRVLVAPEYIADQVLSRVETSLRTTFSFKTRSFSQLVVLSEVISVIQGVPGVVAADVDLLYRDDVSSVPVLNSRLISGRSFLSAIGEPTAAELLTLHDDPLAKLDLMT